MAIVVNPVTRETPNDINQLALQIIAQKQAQSRANARDDINKAFENAEAELKDAVQSGKLLQMLQYDDTTPAAQAMVQKYMTARAAREGRPITPKELERETQTFLQKFSQNALLTPELVKAEERNYRPPASSSAPTSSPASSSASPASTPSPNQTSSGPVTTATAVPIEAEQPLIPDTITGEVPPAAQELLKQDVKTVTALENQPYKGKTFEEAKAQLIEWNKDNTKLVEKLKFSRTWDDLKNSGVREGWKAMFGEYPDGSTTRTPVKSTKEISNKSKEIVMNLSSTGDEMPVRVPKIAQETAKELQGKTSIYEKLKAEGGLLARMKARKLEAQAAKVWKATKMSPDFKRISQDEYKYWDKWAKEATPEQLAISGMEEVAKIKNEADRIRVTKLLGQAELEYSYLKAAASAGNDAAAITLKQIDANVELVKGMLSATKGDEKAFNKLLTNESFNSAVKAIGALNGVKPEDMFNFIKTWTGGVKAIPQNPSEWVNPFGALRQGLQAQPSTSAAATYIQEQTKGR